MNGLDLFSGIGGVSLALAPWVTTVAYCEIDHFARGVLLSRMADGQLCHAPIWDDVTTLRAADFGTTRIDIITGGFPCQDLSLAGSRAGLDGERSGLYREIIRLVSELRPSFVFLENVPAIRTYASAVIGDLAALGFDSRWTTLSAAEVGAPHKRERWWCLAANADRRELWQQPEWVEQLAAERRDTIARIKSFTGDGSGAVAHTNGGRQSKAARRRKGGSAQDVADTNGSGLAVERAGNDDHGSNARGRESDGRFALRDWQDGRRPFPAVRGVDDGISQRVDRLRALGNAVAPACAREAFRLLAGL